MWALWLVTQCLVVVVSVKPHTFYLLAAVPAIAALAGSGIAAAWTALERPGWRRWSLPIGIVVTTIWSVHLTARFPDFHPRLATIVAGIGTVATLLALITSWPRPESGVVLRHSRAIAGATVGVGLFAVLLTPAVWAMSVTGNLDAAAAHRPAAGPSVGEATTMLNGRSPRFLPHEEIDRLKAFLRAHRGQERYALAVQWVPQAGPFILDGMTVLPVGGFTGQVPNVTPGTLADLVRHGRLRYALVDGPKTDGMVTQDYRGYAEWVTEHCVSVAGFSSPRYTLYDCRPDATT
jgi:4-amino-4-deoxy-L-arabinose transferase-like glycosyltransferase